MDTASFHHTSMGAFGFRLLRDPQGYVHLTTENACKALVALEGFNPDAVNTRDLGSRIANENRRVLEGADKDLLAWQRKTAK